MLVTRAGAMDVVLLSSARLGLLACHLVLQGTPVNEILVSVKRLHSIMVRHVL